MKPMLAEKWNGENVSGWWASEKLDGVRAIWDGEKFVSRNGNVFPQLAGYRDMMPEGVVLDGELWLGRGRFQDTLSAVKRGDWSGLTFMVFDMVSDESFEKRQKRLKLIRLPFFCGLLQHTKVRSMNHLTAMEDEVLAAGGEGLMVRRPSSFYEQYRTPSLLKIKRFSDSEATVIGYSDKTSALMADWNGTIIKVGSGLSENQRFNPPAIGSVITFSYFGKTETGQPRHASLVAVRNYE